MAILNLGSINIDHVYLVPHLPGSGETIASSSLSTGLGGKGANQSIAAAKAGAEVWHLGAVGPEGDWCISQLESEGVKVDLIASLDVPTGHAIINVDDKGENSIVLFEGANRALNETAVDAALVRFEAGDWLLFQNETNLTGETARKAKAKGLKVAYAAAPFSAEAVREVLDHIDLLAVNEIEATQLAEALGVETAALPVSQLLVTKGSKGAEYQADGTTVAVPAFPVKAVDTTGAGDTFLGCFLAALDKGVSSKEALQFASAAAAIQVTRPGAASAIPELSEVQAFLRMM
jgi:ribokinase